MIRAFTAIVLGLLGAAPGRCQDVASGPDRGGAVPTLKVFDVTGMNAGKTVDYARLRKDRPTVYLLLWARGFDRPMNRYMRTLDEAVAADYPDVTMVAVWLTGDMEATKTFLARVQQSVKYQATALTCFPDERNGPEGWNINSDARLTVVVAAEGKVKAVFGYNSLNEDDTRAVRKALAEVVKK